MIIEDYKVDKLYGAHSVTLYEKDIALDAKTKVEQYIRLRREKDQEIEELAMKLVE